MQNLNQISYLSVRHVSSILILCLYLLGIGRYSISEYHHSAHLSLKNKFENFHFQSIHKNLDIGKSCHKCHFVSVPDEDCSLCHSILKNISPFIVIGKNKNLPSTFAQYQFSYLSQEIEVLQEHFSPRGPPILLFS